VGGICSLPGNLASKFGLLNTSKRPPIANTRPFVRIQLQSTRTLSTMNEFPPVNQDDASS
jgi:hypothetical protein